MLSPLWPLLAWLAFGALVVLHARLFQRIDRARNAERWYERGSDRLAGRWAGDGRDGSAFLEGHSYAHDLDLFGRASLFELINTARTGAGETTLAEWLRAGSPIDEIRARQAGGRGTAADARLPGGRRRARRRVRQLGAPGPWRPGRRPRPQVFRARSVLVLPVLAAVTAGLAGMAYGERISVTVMLLWIGGVAEFQWLWRRRFEHAIHAVETPEHDLALLLSLLERIEREPFASPRLTALKQALVTGRVSSPRVGSRSSGASYRGWTRRTT